MKKVKYRNSASGILVLSLAILLAFSTTVFSQDEAAATATETESAPAAGQGDPANGKKLFNANCAACHKLDTKMTGPALRGVGDKHSKEWLYSWIHNSAAMIASGDADAVKLFNEYNKTQMTPFPQLSEKDIDDIIAYTMAPKEEPKPAVGTDAAAVGATQTGGGLDTNIILAALILGFGLMIVMLYVVNQTLRRVAEANGLELKKESEKRLPIWKAFIQNQFLVIVTTILLLLASAYFAYGYLMQVGVDQGYKPVQPIHFSHRIHAGDNGIDCKYCHSAARVSKTSGIPSLNVCMNCHKTIGEVAESTGTEEHSKSFYDGEIQKLYKAVGWDASAQKYTGETEPVKWVRIHNLPDFVYFNHSQHVSVAGVECQYCHGPVETYEVMEQFAPLTMGWCINCHRETNIKMEGNEYYQKIHDELAKKYGAESVKDLTIAEMGGLECGKCHY